MATSYTLTKDLREHVLQQLVIKATTKSTLLLRDKLTRINNRYWEKQRRAAEKLLGISRDKWAPLMQAGVLRLTTSAYPKVPSHKAEGEPEGEEKFAYPLDLNIDRKGPVYAALRKHGVIGGPIRESRYDHNLLICLVAPSSVPDLNGADRIQDQVLARQLSRAADTFQAIVDAADEFTAEAERVLAACRTYKQVLDRFPEAAKMLPAPVENRTEMMPQEQIDRVRTLLETGIPS